MPEPTGEVSTPAVPVVEASESTMIGMPPGMTQERLDEIKASMVPKEPTIDVDAQRIAQQRIMNGRAELERASAEAVAAAKSTKESLGLE